MAFYVDTCVYVNLLRKEAHFGKLAESFFSRVQENKEVTYVSSYVTNELRYILSAEEFERIVRFFRRGDFREVIPSYEERDLARKIESECDFSISFADCIHIVLAKRLGAKLITRDRLLLAAASTRCLAGKPEEF